MQILAKLACGLHKPNRQTVLPQSSVSSLYSNLPIKKIRSLGGKFGDYITEVLGCETMSDLTKYTEAELQKYFDEKHGLVFYCIQFIAQIMNTNSCSLFCLKYLAL